MAITYTAGTAVESTASVTSTTVTLPAGLASGDYTIIIFALNATTGTITTPAGWTDILASTRATASTSSVFAIFYRKWVSGDTNPAVTTTSGRTGAVAIKVSGADPTTFIDVSAASPTQAGAATTSVVAPTITPTTTDVVFCFEGRSPTNGLFVTPWGAVSGLTKIAEACGKATTATNAGCGFFAGTFTAGAATGTKTSIANTSTTGAMGYTFSLNAAVTATTVSPTGIASAESVPAPVMSGPGIITPMGTPSVYENASATSAVVPVPSGTTTGELLLLEVCFSGATPPNTTPSGWTLIGTVDGGAAVQTGYYYRVSDGTENGTSVTVNSTTAAGRVTGLMQRYAGVDNTTPLDVAYVSGASAIDSGAVNNQIVAPAITTVTNNALVVRAAALNVSSSQDYVTPAGQTLYTESTGTGRRLDIWLKGGGVAGSTGTATFVQGVPTASLEMIGTTLALRPATTTGTTLSPSGIASGETFGTPTATATLTASPSGIASGEAAGTPSVTIPITAAPSGIASAQTFGAAVVALVLAVTPTGIGTGEAFGVPTATATLTSSPTGITTAEAFGTPTATKTLSVAPTGIASGEAMGTPSVSVGYTAAPAGIASAEACGTPSVTGALTVTPSGVASAEALGTPTASILTTATPTGITSAEVFGVPSVGMAGSAAPTGIPSGEAFGAVTAIRPVTAQPTGIVTAELVSNVVVSLPYTVTAVGIATAQAMGNPTATTVLTVQPVTLGDMAQFGTPTVGGLLTVGPVGIGTAYGPGFPSVTYVTRLQPFGIASAEFVETPRITNGVDTSRDLVLSFDLLERPLSPGAIDYPWTVAEIVHPITGGVVVPVWTFEAAERHITAQLLEGDMADRIIQKSTGAVEYVGGTITEDTGRDISGASVRLALGSATDPGAFVVPAQDTSGPLNVRRVTMLVGAGTANTPKGEYWVWAKVTDTSETTILRLPQKVVVR